MWCGTKILDGIALLESFTAWIVFFGKCNILLAYFWHSLSSTVKLRSGLMAPALPVDIIFTLMMTAFSMA